mmetsp:Transcript_23003/g.64658  ORF Transcript_23003/g.64658 Transcript_23003/m.64658 type:complete len:388 (-) Transcript_23003:123-1286(-)
MDSRGLPRPLALVQLALAVSSCLAGSLGSVTDLQASFWQAPAPVIVSAFNPHALYGAGVDAAVLGPTAAPAQPPPVDREQVCQVCSRQCSVSCFVGACGLDYPMGVERFQDTPLCSSCDESATASISGAGEFRICTLVEASQSTAPTIPAGTSDKMQELIGHSTAMQVKSSIALAAVQSAHQAFANAMTVYNQELGQLRAVELRTNMAKQEMERMAEAEKHAKGEFAMSAAAAQQAVQAISAAAAAELTSSSKPGTGSDAASTMARMQAQDQYRKRLLDESSQADAYKRAKFRSDEARRAVPKVPQTMPMMLAAVNPAKVERLASPLEQSAAANLRVAPQAGPLLRGMALQASMPMPVAAGASLGPGVEMGMDQGIGIPAGAWFDTL